MYWWLSILPKMPMLSLEQKVIEPHLQQNIISKEWQDGRYLDPRFLIDQQSVHI